MNDFKTWCETRCFYPKDAKEVIDTYETTALLKRKLMLVGSSNLIHNIQTMQLRMESLFTVPAQVFLFSNWTLIWSIILYCLELQSQKNLI